MNRLIVVCIGLLTAASIGTGAGGVSPEQENTTSVEAAHQTVRESMRDLWRSNVHAFESDGRLDGLSQTIRRVESIRLPEESGKQLVLPKRPATEASKADRSATPRLKRTPCGTLPSPQSLPKEVADPSELADSLFCDGQLAGAAPFYEMAIAEAPEAEQEAWLLFQKANCQRETDALAAAEAFGELIAKHPDSIWCPMAKVQKNLIEWRAANGLATLLKEIEKAGLE